MGTSPGWGAVTVATYCPSRMVEHPKSKSIQPRYSTTRVTLYNKEWNFILFWLKIHFKPNFLPQKSIRSDLKSMSIEEMQKLKEEIGLKLFNKAVRGDDGAGEREEKRRRKFPRENKVCGTLNVLKCPSEEESSNKSSLL